MNEEPATRMRRSRERIAAAYRHEDGAEMPFLVHDVNYWLSGERANLIPDDYFTDCDSMLRYQADKIRRHMETIDDDFIPFLFPWYGTGVLASALGAEVLFQDKMDPAVRGAVIREVGQIKRLALPDPRKDGLMPRVLKTIRHFRRHSDWPISVTDPQGPLTTALTLVGAETLFVWFYEHPSAVRELLEFCTEAFILWTRAQKEVIGERGRDCFPHGIVLPAEFGGVWLCDDDCGQISPEHYREFVVPCNERIFREFGGGTLHFCGSAEHQIDNLARTDGLVGVNNFCMGNFRQVYRMQQAFEGRIALKVCDFTPLNIRRYYADLFAGLRRRGTIVASYVLPELALNAGKYEMVSRSAAEMAGEVHQTLTALVGGHRPEGRA